MATAWTQGDMPLPGSITAEAVFHFLSKIGLAEEAAEAEKVLTEKIAKWEKLLEKK